MRNPIPGSLRLARPPTSFRPLGPDPSWPGTIRRALSPLASVRQLGTKTFYRKAGRRIDSEVTQQGEANAIDLEPFSDACFNFARRPDASRDQYLSFEEPVTVKLAGRVYRINRATP